MDNHSFSVVYNEAALFTFRCQAEQYTARQARQHQDVWFRHQRAAGRLDRTFQGCRLQAVHGTREDWPSKSARLWRQVGRLELRHHFGNIFSSSPFFFFFYQWLILIVSARQFQIEVATGHFPYPTWHTVFDQLNQVVLGDPPQLSPNQNGQTFSLEFVNFVNTWLVYLL